MPTKESETNLRRFSAGAISGMLIPLSFARTSLISCAGMISVFFTYPLELVRVRMAFQTRSSDDKSSKRLRPSFMRAITQIYNEGVLPVSPASPPHLQGHKLIYLRHLRTHLFVSPSLNFIVASR
jgi:solute carrier family 25 protein 16